MIGLHSLAVFAGSSLFSYEIMMNIQKSPGKAIIRYHSLSMKLTKMDEKLFYHCVNIFPANEHIPRLTRREQLHTCDFSDCDGHQRP